MLILLNLLFWALIATSLFVVVKTILQIKKDSKIKENKDSLLKNLAMIFVSFVIIIEMLPTAISTSGIYFTKKNDVDKAIFLSKLASNLTFRSAYKGELLGNVGSFYFYSRDFDNADVYFEKAKSYLKKSSNFIYIEWLYDAGMMYFVKSDLEKANFYNKKVEKNDLLASGYILQNDYKNALEAISKAPETVMNCAIKSFVHKKMSNMSEFKTEYEKAMSLAHTDSEKKFVSEISKNFDKHLVGYLKYWNSSFEQETPVSLESYIYNLK